MIQNTFKKYLKKNITQISLSALHRTSKNINSQEIFFNNKFIKEELSIRLSHRINQLLNLSYGLPLSEPIKNVINLYDNSLNIIEDFKLDRNNFKEFSNELISIKDRHSKIEFDISNGIRDIKSNFPSFVLDNDYLNNELDKFFISRIGIRTLILQNYEITNHHKSIFTNCKIKNIISDCISDIDILSERNFGDKPNIKVNCNENLEINYLASHIYYIISEVLKNAVISHNKINILDEATINIDILDSNKELIIKISDEGDSFESNNLEKVFTYSYSTEKIHNQEYIIGGFGFGLPLARIYSKYLGGNLLVNPKLNHGTEVFIYLNKELNLEERII